MNEIHVCFSTDNNYAPYCGVAVKSVLMNAAADDRIHIYIMHAGLHAQHITNFNRIAAGHTCVIDFIIVDQYDFEGMPIPIWRYLSIEAYFRFAIARMLPHIDKVIYLDCDVLVRGSLAALYNVDIEYWSIAMVKNYTIPPKEDPGYNSGVVLINCEKWRNDCIEKKLFEFPAKNKDMEFPDADQDIINMVLKDSILEIPSDWNVQTALLHMSKQQLAAIDADKSTRVIHYISFCKPWHGMIEDQLVDEYYHYAGLVPWKIPDHRARNRGIDAVKYYAYQGSLRVFLRQRQLRQDGYLLIMTDIGDSLELQYAALDIGISSVEVVPFGESDLHRLQYDYLLVVCKNILIVDDIMKRHGYHMDKLDYLCLIDPTQSKDDQQIIAEYMAFLSEGGNE